MRLTKLRPKFEGKNEYWIYVCECGKEKTLTRRSVDSGRIKSCGCFNQEKRIERNTKHGLASRDTKRPEIYWTWVIMKQRCSNKNNISYKYYGGKGVSVCDRWMNSFINFQADMGDRPSKLHTIDRINP